MTPLKPKKILVIDDDMFLLASIKSFIRGAGYAVETATRGDDALSLIKQELPDLIILDAIMPEMNGFEVARQIRAIDNTSKIPIIMLTGLRTEADKENAKASGITEFINKPIKPEELLRRVQFHLRPKFF